MSRYTLLHEGTLAASSTEDFERFFSCEEMISIVLFHYTRSVAKQPSMRAYKEGGARAIRNKYDQVAIYPY